MSQLNCTRPLAPATSLPPAVPMELSSHDPIERSNLSSLRRVLNGSPLMEDIIPARRAIHLVKTDPPNFSDLFATPVRNEYRSSIDEIIQNLKRKS